MSTHTILFVVAIVALVACSVHAYAEERQITSSPKNHMLDNNDNFSPNNRSLCYDTRESVGPGIENSQSIELVEIDTGKEIVLYAAKESVTGAQAAPGIGAVSFCPTRSEVAFIHGPELDEVPLRGYYAKPNRRGASVHADGKKELHWLDCRDIATDRPTLPGAHRGGTHRHEFTHDGSRIGFTYDDFLLPQYGRTIGFMMPRDDAPGDASHYFALLLRVMPRNDAKPGDIVMAVGDSWVGRKGLMRAFIGTVMEEDGSYQDSLFVVDVPANVDITTAKAGTATEYPTPPEGLTIRRLTHEWASGVVRGALDGDRIAYYAKAHDGTTQIFVIPSDGSDQDAREYKRPAQATHFVEGAGPGLRWHPSGNSIACIANNGVAVTCVTPGLRFGETQFLTPQGDQPERSQLVWSYDGKRFAYCKPVPTKDAYDILVTTYDGKDYTQIFILDFPDENGNGVID